MKRVQNTEKAGVIPGFMTLFPSETLHVQLPSTQRSPGNEKNSEVVCDSRDLAYGQELGCYCNKTNNEAQRPKSKATCEALK